MMTRNEVSQRSAGPCRSGSRPDPRDQGVLRCLRSAVDRLEHSLAGDAIGAIALAVALIALLWIGQGLWGL